MHLVFLGAQQHLKAGFGRRRHVGREFDTPLLGAHAQTLTNDAPVFYFIPAKQEAETGVNAGDLILIRLERKTERRQFEIATSVLWRVSSGISITHRVQLFRSEEKPGVFKLASAGRLAKGEYALYLTRGEGLSAYVYDFSVDLENERKSTSHRSRP
jgi:hypothetical protein